MNAPARLSAPTVRAARLDEADEAQRIEAFVRAMPGGTIFHTPRWLKAVERGCGQPAHMLLAERGGEISGILPLTAIHSPFFGRALVSSGFGVGGGILAASRSGVGRLGDAAWSLAETLHCDEVELRGGEIPKGWESLTGIYADFTRPLEADADAQLQSIARKQRAEIRKSLEADLRVDIGSGERSRAAHYRIYATSVRNLGTPVFPRSLFDAVLDMFGDEADIMTVRHQGRAVASVLTLYFEGRAMPYWGGGLFEARALKANERMYFSLMNHAREAKGCDRFDFGRSKIGTGPYHYKKNWGFKPEPLVYARKLAPGVEPREINPQSSRYRMKVALWKKLPLFVANRLGPFIARGLG
ncbi:MAG: FemAB family PEP-CTERM system-associated protein [Sphingomonadales bacterium]|nr:FemAB family PEP-CTERM system-associated protein [Sphingomonadales bacterium]